MEPPEECFDWAMEGATKKRLCIAIECNPGMPLNRAIQEDTDDGTVHITVPDLQATLSRKDVIINSSILFVDGNNSTKRVKLVDEPPPVYELKFNEPPSAPVYTTRKLSGASKNGLQIKLVEVGSDGICKESLFSSLQVEIFLVDGDFRLDKLKSTWTIDKLYGKRLHARKGKRPLLLGACIKSLHDGRATFNDLSITDNSSWVSSGKFKLAASIKPDSCNGLRIKGALSDPFVVRECRVEARKKQIESLEDPVWRLCNIAKDGRYMNKLNEREIYTVADLLEKLDSDDGDELKREIGMQEMRWQATIKQAKDFRSSCHANMSNPTACVTAHEPIMLNAAEPNEDSLCVADFQAQNNKDLIMQEMRSGEGSGTDISPLELSVPELIMSDGPVPNTDSLHAPDPQSQHMFDRYQSDPETYLRSGQSFNGNTPPNENPEGMLGLSTQRGLTNIDVDDVSSLELDAALSTSDYLPYSVWTNI